MKKTLWIIAFLIIISIPFVEAKDNGSIEHIWWDTILSYDWETITIHDESINYDTQKCPIWYHIWSADDWSNIITMWRKIKWDAFKFMKLWKKDYSYIEEDFLDSEYKTDEIWWVYAFIEDVLNWDNRQYFKTSSKWNRNQPYMVDVVGLKYYLADTLHRWWWHRWYVTIKTCTSINGLKCDLSFSARCFKDNENYIITNHYSKEYNEAYIFAYNNKITTMPTIEQANMTWEIIRAEIAKMLANWVKKFWYYADPNIPCNFTDTTSVKWDLAIAIIESCKYWIMWQWITQFRPYDKITKAEVATAVSRILRWTQYNWWTPFYLNHVNALKNAWVLTDSFNINSNELRGNVMTILMRANDIITYNSIDCDDPLIISQCYYWQEICPEKCKNN